MQDRLPPRLRRSLIVVNDVSMEIARYSHGPHYAVNQYERVKNFFFEPASAAET